MKSLSFPMEYGNRFDCLNGRSKPVQQFIQHHVFAMLDEMLEWFAQLQNL